MQEAHFERWLNDAVSEVLESMCFLSSEVIADIPEGADRLDVSRRVEFHGSYTGSFGIAASMSTARMLACNFLGEESGEPDAAQAGETVGEIANMICGSLLSRIDSKQAFALSQPYNDSELVKDEISCDRACLAFALDEGTLTAWLEIERSL